MKLRAESRTLKLTASPELIQIFDSLEKLVEQSMKAAHSFIADLPSLQIKGDQNTINARLESLLAGGKAIELQHHALEARMRHELSQI